MKRQTFLAGFVALAFLTTISSAQAEAPADAFCVVVIQPVNDFRQVRIIVDEDVTPGERDATWQVTDVDSDGTVTADEAGGFRSASLIFWPSGSEMGNKSVVLEAKARYVERHMVTPIYATTWRQLGHGFPGVASGHYPLRFPLRQASQFETQAVREYSFQTVPDQTDYWVHGGGLHNGINGTVPNPVYVPRVVIEYVVVTAPPGWRIESVQGFGYNGSFVKERVNESILEIEGFDTSAPWSIQYLNPAEIKKQSEQFEDGGIPGPAVVPIAVALLGAAMLVRRRAP